jgi:hypothetical protein
MSLINPYCTVEQVQKELKNTSLDVVAEIERAINEASRWIDRHLERDFLFHDYSTAPLVFAKWSKEVIDEVIYLPWPIIALTAVTVGGTAYAENVDYYVPTERNGERRTVLSLAGNWPVGMPPDDTIELTGTFGYAQADTATPPTGLPDEISKAAAMIAAAFSNHNKLELVAVDGSKQTVIDKQVPKTALDILGPRKPILI